MRGYVDLRIITRMRTNTQIYVYLSMLLTLITTAQLKIFKTNKTRNNNNQLTNTCKLAKLNKQLCSKP